MSTFKPLYLAELSVEHNGQAITMGQAIQTARAGEGIMGVMVAMITSSPDYRGAEQLTALHEKTFR